MSVTVRQIAEEASVSIGLVSEVLRGGGARFRRETHERVRAVAARLNYRPNTAARAMRTGRFGSVALVQSIHGGPSYMPPDLQHAITTALSRHGMHLVITSLSDAELSGEALPLLLRERAVDGVILNYQYAIPPSVPTAVDAQAIPTVWINALMPFNAVRFDDFGAGHTMTARLIALGHRRIAYANCSLPTGATHYSATDRQAGYAAAMEAAGLVPLQVAVDGRTGCPYAGRLEFMMAWLRQPDRPTAVVCYGGEADALLLAAARLGIAVPDELSLAVLGTRHPCVIAGVQVDAMSLPFAAMAECVVTRLRKAIETGASPEPTTVLPMDDETGSTVAPPCHPARIRHRSKALRHRVGDACPQPHGVPP